jgi:hypothetical protein
VKERTDASINRTTLLEMEAWDARSQWDSGYRSWSTSARNLWQCRLSFVLFCWKHCRMTMSPCSKNFLQRRDASAEQALSPFLRKSPARKPGRSFRSRELR